MLLNYNNLHPLLRAVCEGAFFVSRPEADTRSTGNAGSDSSR